MLMRKHLNWRVGPQTATREVRRATVSDSGQVRSLNSNRVRQASMLEGASHGKSEPQMSEQRVLKEGSVE